VALYYGCLLDGFEELGYANGKTELIHRFPDEKPEKFQSMAAELVALAPDVLVGVGGAAPYVKKATSTIPMVFMYVADPIGAKLVESIRHPGGNATGLTNFGLELVGKRLEYLKEINPQLARVAMMVNPTNPISNFYIEQSNAAGPKLGLTCKPYNVRTLDDLEGAFDAMVGDGMEAVMFNAESLFYVRQEEDRGACADAQIAVLRLRQGSAGCRRADLLRRGPAPDRAPHRLFCRPHPER
jgi:putative tryptophan/tyrosine transport system substrate-binding protein